MPTCKHLSTRHIRPFLFALFLSCSLFLLLKENQKVNGRQGNIWKLIQTWKEEDQDDILSKWSRRKNPLNLAYKRNKEFDINMICPFCLCNLFSQVFFFFQSKPVSLLSTSIKKQKENISKENYPSSNTLLHSPGDFFHLRKRRGWEEANATGLFF